MRNCESQKQDVRCDLPSWLSQKYPQEEVVSRNADAEDEVVVPSRGEQSADCDLMFHRLVLIVIKVDTVIVFTVKGHCLLFDVL